MLKTATFAGGCFWCTEAIFRRLRGVTRVISGYTGGTVPNPTYEMISGGETGHAEAVEIYFDPKEISFESLLQIFWKLHDPTTPNQQGADIGTQYRSAVFYHDNEQKFAAENLKSKLENSGDFSKSIVTEISPAGAFYSAETYHEKYYDKNKNAPYCRLVIDPKINKLMKEFPEKVSGFFS